MARLLPLSAVCLAAVVALAACSSEEELEGRGYMPPSEVTASRAIPLTVPPDLGLRPESGPASPAGATVIGEQEAASEIDVAALEATPAEQSLMVRAGVLEANPDIRRVLDRENALFTGDPALVDALLFGEYPAGGAVEVEQGAEVAPDVAIEQGEPVDDESTWLDNVADLF